jgi:hypothetical protein
MMDPIHSWQQLWQMAEVARCKLPVWEAHRAGIKLGLIQNRSDELLAIYQVRRSPLLAAFEATAYVNGLHRDVAKRPVYYASIATLMFDSLAMGSSLRIEEAEWSATPITDLCPPMFTSDRLRSTLKAHHAYMLTHFYASTALGEDPPRARPCSTIPVYVC